MENKQSASEPTRDPDQVSKEKQQEKIATPRTEGDQHWADRLAPSRRAFFHGSGALAVGLLAAEGWANDPADDVSKWKPIVPPADQGTSPWGYDTYKEPTPRPKSLWPGSALGLPTTPRAYTDIKSYHAHVYFDEDSFEKAALLRKWCAERFSVELGNWNLEPRGPHVTPSFYFGFTNDLLAIIVPWLQLNSLGLTILLHPNTDDPRSDHLYYTMWINRTQPVNAYSWPQRESAGPQAIEKIFPNTRPTVALEK